MNAGALLSLEDSWLVEQAHWLDRRGVRVVVDGTGVDEAQADLVIAKLRLLKKSPRDLIVSHPSAAPRASAETRACAMVDRGAVHYLAKNEDRFREGATLNVVDLNYRTEEDLCHDLARFSGGAIAGELRGERDLNRLFPAPMASGGVNHAFLTWAGTCGPY